MNTPLDFLIINLNFTWTPTSLYVCNEKYYNIILMLLVSTDIDSMIWSTVWLVMHHMLGVWLSVSKKQILVTTVTHLFTMGKKDHFINWKNNMPKNCSMLLFLLWLDNYQLIIIIVIIINNNGIIIIIQLIIMVIISHYILFLCFWFLIFFIFFLLN